MWSCWLIIVCSLWCFVYYTNSQDIKMCSFPSVDRFGSDYSDYQSADEDDCALDCLFNWPQCESFAFVDQTSRCYLKTTVPGASFNPEVYSGYICPAWSPYTPYSSYEVNKDRWGSDIYPSGQPGTTAVGCMKACNGNSNCFSWAFTQSTKVCWLKNAIPSQGHNNDVISGYMACPQGTISGPSINGCMECAPGKYQSGRICANCTAGSSSDSGATFCHFCSAGKFSSAGGLTCVNCAPGTFSSSGASSCNLCSYTFSNDLSLMAQCNHFCAPANFSAVAVQSTQTGFYSLVVPGTPVVLPLQSEEYTFPVKGMLFEVAGIGQVLINFISANNVVVDTLYGFASSPLGYGSNHTKTSITWCNIKAVEVVSIKILALDGVVQLQDVQVFANVSMVENATAVQDKPHLVHWFYPSAQINISWVRPNDEIRYQIGWSPNLANAVPVLDNGAVDTYLLRSLSANINYTITITGFTPFFINSAGTLWALQNNFLPYSISVPPLECPPGYYVGSDPFNCSPCPNSTFHIHWNLEPGIEQCATCPIGAYPHRKGSSYCFYSITQWSFDNLTQLMDSITGYDGEFNHTQGCSSSVQLSFADAVFGNGSLYSDGNSCSWVQLPRFDFFCSDTMNCATHRQNSWSIALWFKPTAVNRYHALFTDWIPGANRYIARISPYNAFEWLMIRAPGHNILYGNISSAANAVSLGRWSHLVVNFDQFFTPDTVNVSMWIDGAMKNSATFNSHIRITTNQVTGRRIGYAEDGNYGFAGFIDEIWTFNGVLTSSMINNLITINNVEDFSDPSATAMPQRLEPTKEIVILNSTEAMNSFIEANCPTSLDPPTDYDLRNLQNGEEYLPHYFSSQNPCGQCWAFASSAAAGYWWRKTTGHYLTFSAQQIASCAGITHCNGKYYPDVKDEGTQVATQLKAIFNWFALGKQLCTAESYPWDYPYIGMPSYDRPCKPSSSCDQAQFIQPNFFVASLTTQNANQKDLIIKKFIYNCGPLVAGVRSSTIKFQSWNLKVSPYLTDSPTWVPGGIGINTEDYKCGKIHDHAMLMVGWKGNDYFIFQNSQAAPGGGVPRPPGKEKFWYIEQGGTCGYWGSVERGSSLLYGFV